MITRKILLVMIIALPMILRAAGAPSVRIDVPVQGSVIPSESSAQVLFSVENFTFVDYKNNLELYPADPDAGHLRWWLDSDDLVLEEGNKVVGVGLPLSIGVLEDGPHTLTVELIRNDNSRFEPPIRDSVIFEVGDELLSVRSASNKIMWYGLLLVVIAAGGFMLARLLRHRKIV